mmetsp:Transcript_21603/g.33038  ORF Transcript_21603/g.33038 Transcript_21603/m.33038 type:complete len:213 (+) Transcript_21603:2592-3230(+)
MRLQYLRFIKTRRWEYRMSRYLPRTTRSPAARFALLLQLQCGASTTITAAAAAGDDVHHLLLLSCQYIPSGCDVPRLNLLLRKGILAISEYVQVGTFGVVAPHALDERRTVFAGPVARSNVAIVEIKPIQRQNAGKCILLVCKCHIGGCARSSIVIVVVVVVLLLSFRGSSIIGDVVAVQHDLADFTVLTKVFRLLQQIFAGDGGGQAHRVD